MFAGFETKRIATAGADIHLKAAGDGPPVLLLHGYPQTHACWQFVAPVLADKFTVVVPDLRGYGDSIGPEPDAGHVGYSKRAMAADMVEVMTDLGHDTFSVVGHDRGARVTHRLVMDHPDRVTKMVSLDVVPTLDMWDGVDKARALGAFHWSFLAQPAPLPEKMIAADPGYFAEWLMHSWAADGFEFDTAAMNEYKRCFVNPDVIQATCEDYRAGAVIDAEHDLVDREAGRRITCPVLFLWGAIRGFGGPQGDDAPLDVWRRWADNVSGGPVECGHFLPEEKPEIVAAELMAFLSGSGD